MPAPAFRWSTYEVQVPPDSALRALAVAVDLPAPPQTVTIQLPDLTGWPSPLDKAEILLESAAEVEHALMVQYLYAAYSLKSGDEVTDPAQQAALDETSADSWPQVLLGIAREEMGHLMTVQNLLLLLGLAPNLEREDFPPQKDLYPFALHLEPLCPSARLRSTSSPRRPAMRRLDEDPDRAVRAVGCGGVPPVARLSASRRRPSSRL